MLRETSITCPSCHVDVPEAYLNDNCLPSDHFSITPMLTRAAAPNRWSSFRWLTSVCAPRRHCCASLSGRLGDYGCFRFHLELIS
jgi:hypothetical protein